MNKYNLTKTIFSLNYSFIISIIISLAVLAAFSGVLIADFVMWDDDLNMLMNSKLGGLSFKRIYQAFTDFDSMNRYNPLITINQGILYDFFHFNPLGYHLINWIFHGLSSGLLFLIIRKILLRSSLKIQDNIESFNRRVNIAALLATLCWALHPLRVEPVAWAATAGHNQALFFLLLSTLLYMKAIDLETDRHRYIHFMVPAVLSYATASFSQAIGITYFAVFFIFDIFLYQRIGGAIGWWKSSKAKKVLFEKMIFAIPAVYTVVMSVVVRIKSVGISQPPITLSDFGLIDRIMQATYILSYYLWRPFYPVDLAPVYTTLFYFLPLSIPFVLSAFFVIVVSITLLIFIKRWPLLAALWLSYIILSIPLMGFLEHPHIHCDRYSLITSICLSILIAFALIKSSKNRYLYATSVSFLIIIIFTLGLLTMKQITIWNNSESLFTHTIQTLGDDPYKADIHWRLGKYLYQKGRKNEAKTNYYKTLAINPNSYQAHMGLAEIEYKSNNPIQSISHLQSILGREPNNFMVHYRLAEVYDALNKKKESAYHFELAVALQHSNDSVTSNSRKAEKKVKSE